jgi:pimeloyl-ACP methyl ester carboxylesterase
MSSHVSNLLDRVPELLKNKTTLYLGVGLGVVVASAAYIVSNAFSRSPTTDFKKQMILDKSNYFQVSETKFLEWFEFGASSQEATFTLLFLHGAMTTGDLWRMHDAWAKENQVRIISPSLPGWGLSPLDPFESDPLDWATNDCFKLMKSLGFSASNKFHIVGASLGSIYAAKFALDPTTSPLVDKVMLYVSFSPSENGRNPLKGSQLEGFSTMHKWPLFARLLDKLLILPMLRSLLPGDGIRSVRYQWEGLWKCTDDISSPWPKNWRSMSKDHEVFIISGDTDDLAPVENQTFLHKEIIGSVLISYKGGHDDHLKKPEDMQQNLMKLLK